MIKNNLSFITFLSKYGTIMGFILLSVIFAFLRPDAFLSVTNIRNIFEQSSSLAIAAFGVTLVMACGDFDLSVGAIASIVGVIMAMLMKGGIPIPIALLISLSAALICGIINALIATYGGVSAFVTTLATMTTFAGFALFLTQGATIFSLPIQFKWLGQSSMLGIPVSIYFMFLVLIITYIILEQIPYGRQIYAIGNNKNAAFFSGINIQKVRFIAFIISALTSGMAGIILTSRLFSAHPQAGNPLMLNSAAAVFLGMTVVRSGEPHVLGTLLGVLIMTVMGNGLNILAINTYVQQMLTGGIIVLAVLLPAMAKKREA